MDKTVRLVFMGELVDGFALEDVKRELGTLLRLDDAKLQMLFAGGRVVLKRGMAPADAERYAQRLAAAGARVRQEVEEAELSLAPEAPVAPPAPPAAPELALQPLTPAAAAAPAPAAPAAAAREVTCPNCGERQPMQAFCRKCATNLEVALANQAEEEEKKRAARQAELEARRGGRAAPAAAGAAAAVDDEAAREGPPIWGWGFEGRMGRLRYLTAAGLMFIAFMVIAAAFAVVAGASMAGLGMGGPGVGVWLVLALIFIPAMVMGVRLMILRLHDCNMSGWWWLLSLVPYIGGLFSLVVMLLPGTEGENRFGGLPPKGKWSHALLAFFGPIVGIGVLAAIALPAYQGYVTRARAAQHGLPPPANDSAADPARDGSPADLKPEALEVYSGEYAGGPQFKAFAASRGGAWGWKSGAATLDAAKYAAMDTCEANRKAGTPLCQVVDVNGRWQGFDPAR